MREIEEKITRSFSLAKQDIIKLQEAFVTLSKANKRLINKIEDVKKGNSKLQESITGANKTNRRIASQLNTVKKNNSKLQARIKKLEELKKKAKKTVKKTLYYATKNGRNFHVGDCPAAKKISKINKIIFKSKAKAMKEGFKPCKCVVKRK